MRVLRFGSCLLSLACLAACGGGGGGGGGSNGGGGGGDAGSGNGSENPPVIYDGRFLDSAVEGLTYQSGSNPPGTTDANGTFSYSPGETLTFFLGGIEIGSLADGAAVITPFDFGAEAADNIARFLQTLDEDGDPSNGIDVVAAAAALVGTTLSASVFQSDSATFETSIGPVLETAIGPGAMLVDTTTALAHLVSQTVSPFEQFVFPGHGRIAVFPELDEIGVMSFAFSTAEIIWNSNTIESGGDGTIFDSDWSIDANGALTLSNSMAASTIAIQNVGGSTRVASIVRTDAPGAVPTIGNLLAPVPVTAFSLAGESGRTYDIVEHRNPDRVSRLTFYPDGSLIRVEDNTQFNNAWEIDQNGILVRILEANLGVIRMFVMLNGSVAHGGEILSIDVTILNGNAMEPDLQIDAMFAGTLAPDIATNPDGTVSYSFSTSNKRFGGVPGTLHTQINERFIDMSVSGTFDYDASITARDIDDNGMLIGWPHYDLSFLNLEGSVDGLQFSDPSGVTVVVNDLFDRTNVANPTGFSDLFLLAADPVVERPVNSDGQVTENLISDVTGFDVIGFTLVNVSLLWVEGQFGEVESDLLQAPDFLSNGHMPPLLPDIPGAVFLDFETDASPDETFGVFFPALQVSPMTVNPLP